MKEKMQKMKKAVSKYGKSAYLGVSAVAAVALGVSQASADYSMAGPALDANVITGLKAGVGDSVATLNTSINNAAFAEIVTMFIGFAAIVGVLMYFLKRHRTI